MFIKILVLTPKKCFINKVFFFLVILKLETSFISEFRGRISGLEKPAWSYRVGEFQSFLNGWKLETKGSLMNEMLCVCFAGELVGHRDLVSGFSFCQHPEQSHICVSSSTDGSVRFWDSNNKTLIRKNAPHQVSLVWFYCPLLAAASPATFRYSWA